MQTHFQEYFICNFKLTTYLFVTWDISVTNYPDFITFSSQYWHQTIIEIETVIVTDNKMISLTNWYIEYCAHMYQLIVAQVKWHVAVKSLYWAVVI